MTILRVTDHGREADFLLDDSGRVIAPMPPVLAVREPGPWDSNTTAARDRAAAPVVALVSRHPDRLVFIGGKVKVSALLGYRQGAE